MKKINVTLRKKAISHGRTSLYLDFYPPVKNPATGVSTRREFLKLYLINKPRSPIDKMENDENLRTAHLIKIRRQTEFNKDDVYSVFEKEQLIIKEIGEQSFLAYFKKQAAKKYGSNHDIWLLAIYYFESFLNNEDLAFSEISVGLISDYRDYLLQVRSKRNPTQALANNSAVSYFNKVKATLKAAYKEGKLRTDINAAVDGISEKESKRNFLTIEEARALATTDCKSPIVKSVGLFSILTGLRYSDIAKLRWSEIDYIDSQGYFIRFKQKKTDGEETLPISDQAYSLLGVRQDADDRIFPGMKKWDFDRLVPVWVAAAGISKHITFHCFRHTYATLQLFNGTDIFTVSKLLGHKSVKTTQVYAKIVDSKKREAAGRITL